MALDGLLSSPSSRGCFLFKLLVLCWVCGFIISSWGNIATFSFGPEKSCSFHPWFSLSWRLGPFLDSVGGMSGLSSGIVRQQCRMVDVFCGDSSQIHKSDYLVSYGTAQKTLFHSFLVTSEACTWFCSVLATSEVVPIIQSQCKLRSALWFLLILYACWWCGLTNNPHVFLIQGE